MLKIALGFFFSLIFAAQAVLTTIYAVMKGTSIIESLPFWLISVVLGYFSWVRVKNKRIESATQKMQVDANLKRAAAKRQLLGNIKHKDVEMQYLGGAGYGLEQLGTYSLGVFEEKIRFVSSDIEALDIAFADITEFEVGGTGTTTTNAGVSGGGFGIEGFIKGAVAAAVINAATTKSSTNTFLKITSNKGEIFMHTAMCEPAELQMILSPLSVNIANRIGRAESVSVADELSKLNDLLKSGVITESDFLNAKNKILG